MEDFCWCLENLQNATQKSQKVFVHVPSEIAAHEVEEIGMLLHKKSSSSSEYYRLVIYSIFL